MNVSTSSRNAKIYINGRFLTQSVTGVQRYAHELIKSIDKLAEEGVIDSSRYSFSILAPANIKEKICLKHIPIKIVGHLKGHLWEQLELPFYAHDGLLINLCNSAPLLRLKQIVTIHDASVFGFPQAYSFAFRTWYRLLLTRLGVTARKIITDSQFSMEELAFYCKIDKTKITLVYLGKEHIFASNPDKDVLRKYGLNKNGYVLAVSSLSPNKNFRAVAEAIGLLRDAKIQFVIAGGSNARVFNQYELSLPEETRCIGYVSDSELRALYENAACFVYPSFYEGFGFPPLEAMACGCPVIVSKASSLPEVCGDAALYCDPKNSKDIAEKIQRVVHDETLRAEMRKKGLARAELYSWERCAKETMAVIQKVLEG